MTWKQFSNSCPEKSSSTIETGAARAEISRDSSPSHRGGWNSEEFRVEIRGMEAGPTAS